MIQMANRPLTTADKGAYSNRVTEVLFRNGTSNYGFRLDASGRQFPDRSLRSIDRWLAFPARTAEPADDRLGDIGKISVVHANAIGMGAGVKDHFGVADEAFLDEDTL